MKRTKIIKVSIKVDDEDWALCSDDCPLMSGDRVSCKIDNPGYFIARMNEKRERCEKCVDEFGLYELLPGIIEGDDED